MLCKYEKRKILLWLLLIISQIGCLSPALSQEAYWVKFKDKPGSSLNPYKYYSPKSIERRVHHQLPLVVFSDLPVSNTYLETLSFLSDSVFGKSRWLNTVMISANDFQIKNISELEFVQKIVKVNAREAVLTSQSIRQSDRFDRIREQQLASLGYDYINNLELTGKGITIAVFDGGFPGVDKHEGLMFLLENKQITESWNFPGNSSDIYKNHPHGTAVLSCIAGKYDEKPTGLAYDATFLLARTELRGEPWKEQLYWIQAAEWADKNGANIICSALGYTSEHYFPEEMDGSSPVAEAARIAYNKGILVINSIGNEGQIGWKILGTPADAEEVLSVGALNIETGIKMEFSSYGPNQNGIMKPNVMASGRVLAATPKSWKIMYGTSFSAPLIAGYAACLWEEFPHLTNQQLFKLIEQTGNLHPYFDYAHGFGIPSAEKLSQLKNHIKQKSLSYTIEDNTLKVKIPSEGSSDNPVLLYYHLENHKGVIKEYKVIQSLPGETLDIEIHSSQENQIIRLRSGKHYSQINLNNE
ncbi:MAG: S8 family serine peptidase [Bacteroidota bacterium]|nr:S8 family serine peptidase [Bacteroidota bacterium]